MHILEKNSTANLVFIQATKCSTQELSNKSILTQEKNKLKSPKRAKKV